MDAMNWVAIIGAAAWTPQIIFILYRTLVRTKVTFYPDCYVQIGYTSLGPIFNLTLALASQKKDIIVNKIGVTLTHEEGAQYNLVWAGMSETISEIRNPLGPTMSVEKSLRPLPIKLSTVNVVQSFFRFQDPSFRPELVKASSGFEQHFNFVRKKKEKMEKQDIELAIDCKEFESLIDFYKSVFHWTKGRYEVAFTLESPNKVRVTKNKFAFYLSQHDVDGLRMNLDHIRTDYRQTLMTNVEGYKYESIPWVWKTPSLFEAKKGSPSLLMDKL